MKTAKDLEGFFYIIDGRGYKAYKELTNQEYALDNFQVKFYYVQGDPFASPSRIRIRVPQKVAGFPPGLYQSPIRHTALADYLTRKFSAAAEDLARGNRGTGKSGMIAIDTPGQEVLTRTSVVINDHYLEARIVVGLPARGRRILGKQAAAIFLSELPRIVNKSLIYSNLPTDELEEHIRIVEDQHHLRMELQDKGLVAFIGNGAVLPRRSGIDDRPLQKSRAVIFRSPPELEVEMEAPNQGKITGMGIPEGVTLIVGGGYHGKSTLLNAIEMGIYDHIPGDGRELVVTVPDAFKIRAEDGREITRVNISPFINNLPFEKDTTAFSTPDASGSTSQAANIMEALELKATLLLIDEDTSATNFMIRDIRMQKLIVREKEPITPFIDKVKQLHRELGVSSIIVIGGAGDYLDVADHVIMMDKYLPYEVTEKARQIAREYKNNRHWEGGSSFGEITCRIPDPDSFDPRRGKKVKIRPLDKETLQFGRSNIDLRNIEQLVSVSQTRAIGDIIYYCLKKNLLDGKRTLNEVLDLVFATIREQGLEVISPYAGQPEGAYAMPRKLEVGAAINRLRSLKIK